MREVRREKIESLLVTLIGKFLLTHKPTRAVVTLMRVSLNEAGSVATAWLSVLPESQSHQILEELEKDRHKLNRDVHDYMKSKFIPEVRFGLDRGEQFRGRMDELLKI
ncbi:MAG TPA: ribosome-binding factor A [Candidatus Paceibacterota bacterium]